MDVPGQLVLSGCTWSTSEWTLSVNKYLDIPSQLLFKYLSGCTYSTSGSTSQLVAVPSQQLGEPSQLNLWLYLVN